MSIAIDWFASTSSDKWKQENSVGVKENGPSFFDYLYINRADVHKATNIVIGVFATLAFTTLIITLISYLPSMSSTLFFKGLPIGGPCCLIVMAMFVALPIYIKYRLNQVEKANSLYYLTLTTINVHIAVMKYKSDPSQERGQRLVNAYFKA